MTSITLYDPKNHLKYCPGSVDVFYKFSFDITQINLEVLIIEKNMLRPYYCGNKKDDLKHSILFIIKKMVSNLFAKEKIV